jgi:hypothetical protein
VAAVAATVPEAVPMDVTIGTPFDPMVVTPDVTASVIGAAVAAELIGAPPKISLNPPLARYAPTAVITMEVSAPAQAMC